MKKTIIISALLVCMLFSCRSIKDLNGNYTFGNSFQLKFENSPNEFQYFHSGEMGLYQYSSGKWSLDRNRVVLIGFNDKNLKMLNVESVIDSTLNGRKTQISIHYKKDSAVSYIKSVIIIDGSRIYTITKDTMISPDYGIKTIQIESYLSYTGLPSSKPKIDTLYSPKMEVSNNSEKNTTISLRFAVHSEDFYRIKLFDTLRVKKGCILLNRPKVRLKKS